MPASNTDDLNTSSTKPKYYRYILPVRALVTLMITISKVVTYVTIGTLTFAYSLMIFLPTIIIDTIISSLLIGKSSNTPVGEGDELVAAMFAEYLDTLIEVSGFNNYKVLSKFLREQKNLIENVFNAVYPKTDNEDQIRILLLGFIQSTLRKQAALRSLQSIFSQFIHTLFRSLPQDSVFKKLLSLLSRPIELVLFIAIFPLKILTTIYSQIMSSVIVPFTLPILGYFLFKLSQIPQWIERIASWPLNVYDFMFLKGDNKLPAEESVAPLITSDQGSMYLTTPDQAPIDEVRDDNNVDDNIIREQSDSRTKIIREQSDSRTKIEIQVEGKNIAGLQFDTLPSGFLIQLGLNFEGVIAQFTQGLRINTNNQSVEVRTFFSLKPSITRDESLYITDGENFSRQCLN